MPFEGLRELARQGTVDATALICRPDSGWFPITQMRPTVFSSRSWVTALLLSVFVGGLGVDRFYLGRIGTGVLKRVCPRSG